MAAKRKKHGKKPGYVFYPMYWCMVLLIIGAILLMMRVLWDNMEDYESTMPKYVVQETEKIFTGRDFATIYEYDDLSLCADEGKEAYIAYMERLTDGFEITCREAFSSNPEEKLYQVKFGPNKLGTFTLAKTGEKTEYGYEKWAVKEMKTAVIASTDYYITVPEDSIVFADGHVLDESKIIESGMQFDYSYLPEGYDHIKWCTYGISRCFSIPAFQVMDSAGRMQSFLPNEEGRLTAELNDDTDELRPQMEENVIQAAKYLSMYTSDDCRRDAVLDYVATASKAHQYIRGIDTGWFMPHRDVEFLNMKTDNYLWLDENTFKCDVTYDYKIIYRNAEEIYPTAYTFFYTKIGEEWLIFDFTSA